MRSCVDINAVETTALHTPPILPAHFKQRIRNLPERSNLHGFHKLGQLLVALYRDVLTLREYRAGCEAAGVRESNSRTSRHQQHT